MARTRATRRKQRAIRGARAKRAKAPFRLSPHVRPLRYAIALELDPQRSRSYRGTVRIELELARPVDVIELHAADLVLGGARVTAGGETSSAQVTPIPEHECVRITPSERLARGSAVLAIPFKGKLRSDLRGLYFARSGRRRYAFSQLDVQSWLMFLAEAFCLCATFGAICSFSCFDGRQRAAVRDRIAALVRREVVVHEA